MLKYKTFRSSLWVIFALGFSTAVTGCGQAPGSLDAPRLSQDGSKIVDPAVSGNLAGKVTFDGVPPAPKASSLKSFAECAVLHKHEVLNEEILINDGMIENVFVYVSRGLEDYRFEAPRKNAFLDQLGCIYKPHILGLQTQQPLTIKNSDVTLHNVHSHSKQNAFNIGMPVQGMTFQRVFSAPEVMVELTCDVHRWMKGYVGVVSHPYFAVTSSDGAFDLKGLPPGQYTLTAWHEVYGTRNLDVSLQPGETKTVQFTFES